MTPGHSRPSQESAVPAVLTVDKTRVEPGSTVELTLAATEGQFLGFIIQARDKTNPARQIGSFIAGDEDKYMTCGQGIHNSITHRSASAKESISSTWRAPSNFKGDVVFTFTLLQDYATYWVRQTAAEVKVTDQPEEQELSEVEEVAVEDETTEKTEDKVAKQEEPVNLDNLDLLEEIFEYNQVDGEEDLPENKILDPSIKSEAEILEKDLVQGLDYPVSAEKSEEPLDLAQGEPSLDSVESFTPIYISSTTTLRTTTTTTAPSKATVPVDETGALLYTDSEDEIYDECNAGKACFGIPDNCVKNKNCVAVVSYYPDRLKYMFEMKAKTSGYVSFGLSRDGKMGEDLTTNCILEANGNVDIATGYNYGKSVNKPPKVKRLVDGISKRLKKGRKDGWIHCSWERNATVFIEGERWALDSDQYHIMLALGNVRDGAVQYHKLKTISAVPLGLGVVGEIASKSRLYIILHGSFMIGAWVCAASLGIILARYYKQTWTAKRLFGLDQWFVWHRSLMILVWSLSIAGLVLIVLELGDISSTVMTNPHTILGFTTVGLAFLQPFLALCRCGPMHRSRWIFNWAHWFIGNAAQILGILCIFFAVELDKAQLPRETDYIILAFVAFHILTHIFLSIVTCISDSKAANMSMQKPVRSSQSPRSATAAYPDYEELKRDNPGTGLRKFTLFFYFILNSIFTTALILLVVYPPARGVFQLLQ